MSRDPKCRGQKTIPWAGCAALAAVLGVAGFIALSFTDFYADDAMISLRYADRLLQGHGLTWTAGERVEGYSNLLWVLATAGLGALGLNLVVATRVLGLLGLAVLLTAVSVGERGPDPRRALSGGAFLAVSGGLCLWAVGGLAQTALAALGALTLLQIRRDPTPGRIASVTALLAAITLLRADGVVLVVALLAAALLHRRDVRVLATMALGPAAAWTAQLLVRLAYYDDWVPNTVRVKVSFTAERGLRGLAWTGDAILDHGLLVGAALVAAWWLGRRALVPLVVAGLWAAYVAWVGGDLFRGWRLFLPALPMLAIVVADAAHRLGRRGWTLLAVAVIAHGAWNLTRWDAYPRGGGPSWTLRTAPMARLLKQAVGARDPLLAVDAAGALPYYTRFRAVDMLGLTDRYLAHNPPPGWGQRAIGHDLGDGAYVLSRAPDIVAFRSGLGGEPRFVSGRQMAADPAWRRDYRLSVFQLPFRGQRVRARYYLRVADGPLAPTMEDGVLRVPGYLLGSDEHPVTRRDGIIGPRIRPGESMEIELTLPQGSWNLGIEGTSEPRAPSTVRTLGRVARFTVEAGDEPVMLEALLLMPTDPRSLLDDAQPGGHSEAGGEHGRTGEHRVATGSPRGAAPRSVGTHSGQGGDRR